MSVLLHVCHHRFCDLTSGVLGRRGAGRAVRKLNSEHLSFTDLQIHAFAYGKYITVQFPAFSLSSPNTDNLKVAYCNIDVDIWPHCSTIYCVEFLEAVRTFITLYFLVLCEHTFNVF